MNFRNDRASAAPRAFALLLAIAIACALSLFGLAACGGGGGSGGQSSATISSNSSPSSSGGSEANGSGSAAAGDANGASFKQPKNTLEPQLMGDTGGEPAIGVDHLDEGYVTAQAASPATLKFQVKCDEQTYNYDLPNDGTQTVFPVNMGDGSYTFRIMQNTSGNNYVELYSLAMSVHLNSEFDPFLVPNIFCDYSASSDCVEKALELTEGASNYGEVVKAVCEYVASNVTYDDAKAEYLATTSGYIPQPDETLATGEGICFDYASLSAAMLRSLGVPTKLMTGYVGKDELYHAWIMVYIDGSWHSVAFSVDPNKWSRCDVTFASTGATKYVGDASAYVDRYTY